jgi:hypothetical protein
MGWTPSVIFIVSIFCCLCYFWYAVHIIYSVFFFICVSGGVLFAETSNQLSYPVRVLGNIFCMDLCLPCYFYAQHATLHIMLYLDSVGPVLQIFIPIYSKLYICLLEFSALILLLSFYRIRSLCCDDRHGAGLRVLKSSKGLQGYKNQYPIASLLIELMKVDTEPKIAPIACTCSS